MPGRSVKPTLQVKPAAAPTLKREVPAAPSVVSDSAPLLRPVLRPSMAILELLDDGRNEGEVFRLRADSVALGRSGADIEIPHDAQISGTHCLVVRSCRESGTEWILKDLDSTNGTFLRVARCVVNSSTPVMMGCYRYLIRDTADQPVVSPRNTEDRTRAWQVPGMEPLNPARFRLVRLHPDGSERLFPVPASESVIGTDPSCDVVVDDDPALSARHARIRCTRDRTVLEDADSRNGLWIAIRERRLKSNAMFLIGEQRIRFRVF